MPDRDMDLTSEHLSKLTYMDACIKETLRLFPTVPLIGRAPSEPIVINNVEIPPGTPVFLGIRQVQRQTAYWGKDAHIFQPERFFAENAQHKENSGCYIPFSLGSRNCIGKKSFLSNQWLSFSCIFLWIGRLRLCHVHDETGTGPHYPELPCDVATENVRFENTFVNQLPCDKKHDGSAASSNRIIGKIETATTVASTRHSGKGIFNLNKKLRKTKIKNKLFDWENESIRRSTSCDNWIWNFKFHIFLRRK